MCSGYLGCSCTCLSYVSPSFSLCRVSNSYRCLLKYKQATPIGKLASKNRKKDVKSSYYMSWNYWSFTCCGTLFNCWWKLFVKCWLCTLALPCSNFVCPLLEGTFAFSIVDLSSFPAHPEDPAGTIAIGWSFPWCSAFRLGKFAGARRAVGILPRLWSPCFWGMVFCWGFFAEPYQNKIVWYVNNGINGPCM